MVNVNVAGGGPGGAIVGRLPCPGCSGAGGVLDDVRAVTFENDFAGVARA